MASSGIDDVLTIDVEDWYHLNYDSTPDLDSTNVEDRVERNTYHLLEILAEHGARATFFYLGSVAARHPRLVRATRDAGHEIASHGFGHELVYKQDEAAFRADVQRSLEVLGEAIGEPVRGYRAPSWSVSKDTPWFYDVLGELGFAYSSSVFPFRTYLYGDSKAPTGWFRPPGHQRGLVEIPATVAQVAGTRLPFSGGFYMRALPLWAIRWAQRRVRRSGRATIFYLHPREIDPEQPRLQLARVDRMVTYWGLKGTERKLHGLLQKRPTTTLAQHLADLGAIT